MKEYNTNWGLRADAVVHIKNGDHLFGNSPSQIEYILLQHDKFDLD